MVIITAKIKVMPRNQRIKKKKKKKQSEHSGFG